MPNMATLQKINIKFIMSAMKVKSVHHPLCATINNTSSYFDVYHAKGSQDIYKRTIFSLV